MQAKAVVRYVRIAPRKARLVVDLIRGKDVGEAFAILRHTPKAASPVVEKLLNSAVANAEHNYSMDTNRLYISEIYVDQGPTLKRYRPRAQGRASAILKRTSHITVVLKERPEQAGQTEKAPQKQAQQAQDQQPQQEKAQQQEKAPQNEAESANAAGQGTVAQSAAAKGANETGEGSNQ